MKTGKLSAIWAKTGGKQGIKAIKKWMQGQHLLTLLPFFPLSDNKDVSVMMSEMDVNAIAGTLKLYFRELPEPLFTDELYPNFAEGIGR